MAIPPLNEHGWRPEGVRECTLEEAATRFGGFQRSDRRPRLWARFVEFVREAQPRGLIDALVVDGSFVTAEPDPQDIDLIGERQGVGEMESTYDRITESNQALDRAKVSSPSS